MKFLKKVKLWFIEHYQAPIIIAFLGSCIITVIHCCVEPSIDYSRLDYFGDIAFIVICTFIGACFSAVLHPDVILNRETMQAYVDAVFWKKHFDILTLVSQEASSYFNVLGAEVVSSLELKWSDSIVYLERFNEHIKHLDSPSFVAATARASALIVGLMEAPVFTSPKLDLKTFTASEFEELKLINLDFTLRCCLKVMNLSPDSVTKIKENEALYSFFFKTFCTVNSDKSFEKKTFVIEMYNVMQFLLESKIIA